MHKIVLEDVERIKSRIDLSSLNKKRVLITGGSGLIGHYLLNLLVNLVESDGLQIEIDSISKRIPPTHSVSNSSLVNSLQVDLGKEFKLDIRRKYDFIIHAAGYGQPQKFLTDEISTLSINGASTISLSKYLEEGGTFLFLSTSEVYLGSINFPNTEADFGHIGPDHQRAPYVIGKSYGETVMSSLRRTGVDAKIARVALAYGPGTARDDSRVLNEFVRRGILEKKISLMDQGKAIRTYCYVADTVEMLMNIALYGKSMIYNVGGISRVTVLELAEMVGETLGVKVTTSLKESFLTSAPQEVSLDMTKYTQEFGAVDFQSLQKGLEHTINWQREILYSEAG
jgi:UDP-glucuronate decarboxylase